MEVQSLIFNLNSPNPLELRAFYRDALGLKPNPDMSDDMLMAGPTPFLIDGHSELSGPSREPARTIMNFKVDDLGAEQARLEAAGVRFLGPPSNEPISFATFVDPDGNYGQIFAMEGAPAGEMFVIMRTSEDPDRLKAFFRNVLGLSDDHPEVGNPFIAGGTSIYIGPHSEVQGPVREPARMLINFFVDDLAAEQRRIEQQGVKFLRTAGREYWGGIISTLEDPDGGYIQLIEFNPES